MQDDELTPEPIPQGTTGEGHDDQGDAGSNLDPDTGHPLLKEDGTPFVPEVDADD